MTTPMPEGTGFSGRLCGMTAQSEPKDVQRSVRVGVRGVAAPLAKEHLPATVARINMPAGMTGARRVGRRHEDHISTGALSLVLDHSGQRGPTRVEDALVQPCLRSGPVGRVVGAH